MLGCSVGGWCKSCIVVCVYNTRLMVLGVHYRLQQGLGVQPCVAASFPVCSGCTVCAQSCVYTVLREVILCSVGVYSIGGRV